MNNKRKKINKLKKKKEMMTKSNKVHLWDQICPWAYMTA
jgi:hypothetical protein